MRELIFDFGVFGVESHHHVHNDNDVTGVVQTHLGMHDASADSSGEGEV